MKSLYDSNDDFKQYVDKYCVKHEVTPEIAFTHAAVRSVAECYQKAVVSKTVGEPAGMGECK